MLSNSSSTSDKKKTKKQRIRRDEADVGTGGLDEYEKGGGDSMDHEVVEIVGQFARPTLLEQVEAA